jgi:hypothetical protein
MKIKSLRAYAVPLLSLVVMVYAGLAPVPPKPSVVAMCSQFPGCLVVQVASFQNWPILR